MLLDSIGDRGGAAIRSGAATKDTVTVDPDKDGSSVADGAGPGESGEVEAPQTVGDPVRFDSSGNVEVYIHLASTDEASLQQVRDAVEKVEIEGPEYGLVQAWVNPDELETVASLDAVKRITPPDYGYTKCWLQSYRR